ncbi:MAG: hypothetical protein JW888_10150 [Pirellulales bacterium]|nr:hypothetical protein [Pirellulales bacterium]
MSAMGVSACLLSWASVAPAAGQNVPSLPKFAEVKKAVVDYFAKLPKQKPGEIISRGQVEPIFGTLDRMGWRVAGRKSILESVLPDNDALVQQLRTAGGRKLARDVAKVPQGYERLDRLRRLPRGQQNIQSLINGPDGYKMIEYMTTTQGGRNLGTMLSKDPDGKNFNKPTERIYTVEMLLDRLAKEYEKATRRKSKPKQTGLAPRATAP